ncbi:MULTISPECIES: hypothetical protein [unclassified Nodularia (in: cyanobacteria)]|uniref:hypothetical protein n=1 Tax=unclassified Nodularia (in: cyanobacteria) TaxID=2656917 RepID=UPI001D119128|nr:MULTISPECIES: hypothetical protein [unclassified Nodularia (in: cyanobacteria)]
MVESYRVPVAVGSIADITFVTERPTTVKEINNIFRKETNSQRYQDILGVSQDPIVSSDIIQDPRASIVDLSMTQVVDGDLVKVMSWYDNEWGYACQMVRQAQHMAKISRPLQTVETNRIGASLSLWEKTQSTRRKRRKETLRIYPAGTPNGECVEKNHFNGKCL